MPADERSVRVCQSSKHQDKPRQTKTEMDSAETLDAYNIASRAPKEDADIRLGTSRITERQAALNHFGKRQ